METALRLISACGRACFICGRLAKGKCRGCKTENKDMNNKGCLIYKCVQKKRAVSCLQCSKNPCKLWKGLSMAYCPVISKLKFEKMME